MATEPESAWTVLKLIKWTADYLTRKGIRTARLDGELLLAQLLGLDRTELYMNFDQPLTSEELARFRILVKRRANREPLQYITGIQEFWSMPFRVSPQVLIPRPETELLVEEGIEALNGTFPHCTHTQLYILDIGTGSGAIAAALAKEVKGSSVIGVDMSEGALALARENIEINDLSSSITLFQGNLFEPVGRQHFHLIVSNPPYIPHSEMKDLQPEVSQYEPASALDGGIDGLDYFRELIPKAIDYLLPDGWLMLEHGMGQAEVLIAIFEKTGDYTGVESVRDLAGIDRVVKGQKKKAPDRCLDFGQEE